jgi:hypothetical protein
MAIVKIILLLLLSNAGFSQEIPNPQSLLEKWDKEFVLEEGLYNIQIYGEPPENRETNGFMFLNSKNDRMIQLRDSEGNSTQKYLFIEEFKKYYLSIKNKPTIFKLNETDSMSTEVLKSSISYYDISGFFIEKNYIVEKMEPYSSKDKKYWKIIVASINKNFYNKLYVYIDKEKLLPYRIDYFTKDGVLSKILRVRYGKVTVQRKEIQENKEIISEMEMTRMVDSKKSYFKILSLRTFPQIDQGLFSLKNLSL